jgi:hypothetical protein
MVSLLIKPGSPLAFRIGGRLVPPYPLSQITLDRLRTWIELSDLCSTGTEDVPRLPNSVLVVPKACDFGLVKLWEMRGEHGHYTALNYCWGSSAHSKTTAKNISQAKRRISIADLPQTFQDAIHLAQVFGIRFIWIDSLCIVRDDIDDWRLQSDQMASVYGGAYLTIAADRSRDSAAGFLGSRELPNHVSFGVEWESCASQVHAYSYEVPGNGVLLLGHSIRNEPLSRRGWALQERMLSRRVVHFTTYQMIFECDYTMYLEDSQIA